LRSKLLLRLRIQPAEIPILSNALAVYTGRELLGHLVDFDYTVHKHLLLLGRDGLQ